MKINQEQNAVAALLAEYKKAIVELLQVIEDLDSQELFHIVDEETANPDCRSIQTILTHVVRSGYSYCVYIQNLKDPNVIRPQINPCLSVAEYQKELKDVLNFTEETFAFIYDKSIEEFEELKKIKTAWGQVYDIEQLMEHAIVHILRHHRQIEKFKILIRK